MGRRPVLLAVALALFVVVTALRFLAGTDLGEGITLLYTLPIGLLALAYGPVAGLLGAAVGLGLFGTWVLVEDVDVSLLAYFTRGAAFALLGGMVGVLARARTRVEAQNTRWFAMSNDMLCEASLDGRFTRLNDRWERCLGWTPAQLMARPYLEFVHRDDLDATLEAAGGLAEAPSELVSFENRYLTKDGSWRWLLWSARSDGQRVYAVAKDVTERKALEEEREQLLARVEAMARTDQLTGLPNRRSWDEELRRELARAQRDGTPLVVAILDLDDFKGFNDRHGHAAGDELLREAGVAWRMRLRACDFLARHGGEEFAVLLPDCGSEQAMAVVERLREATPFGQTCSAGLAHWDGGESSEALVGRADAALYEAKRAGRDRIAAAV